MHYALAAACPGAEVLRAFDINPAANDCYEANFGLRPWQARTLPADQHAEPPPTSSHHVKRLHDVFEGSHATSFQVPITAGQH